MTLSQKPTLDQIKKIICELLQTTDESRVLDSLETVVIQAKLASYGIELKDNQKPLENTIKEWMLCIHQFLKDL
jgi:LEA14-like dessication related protein